MPSSRKLTALTIVQTLLIGWLVFWAAVLVYHLYSAGILLPRWARDDPYTDTYFVVIHFGPLGITLYVALGLLMLVTFLKWRLGKRL